MTEAEGSLEEGRYRRLGKIDAGGMAEVYLAYDVVLQRKVALKVLARDVAVDREFALRLAGEAQAMAALETHQNIVQIFDVIMEGNELCLVLEFVDGMNFKRFMETPEFNEEIALKLLKEAALALAYLHDEKAIIHRDIKPANVLIRSRDKAIKLIDFGIARFESGARLTRSGLIIGTEYYMAPEVRAGRDATPASDIWSLGVVMREALRHLRERNPELPFGALDSIILDMTEEDPILRPRARELARWDPALGEGLTAGDQAGWVHTVQQPDRFDEPRTLDIPATEPFDPETPQKESDHEEAPLEEALELPEPVTPSEDDGGRRSPAALGLSGGQRLSILAGIGLALAVLGWSVSPAGPFHGEPAPQAEPNGAVTSPAPHTSAAEPSPPSSPAVPSVALAGPWTATELNEKLTQPMYKIALNATPARNPFAMTAGRTESVPLEPGAQFAMDNQAENHGGKQVFWHLRLTANRGSVDFTPHITTCAEMAAAGKEDILPGVYMVVPLTDTSSNFAGTPVTVVGKAYAILRAECDPGGPAPLPTMKAGSTVPAQDLRLHYVLPVRPDGSWDKAATPSTGMFMVSEEGRVVMLES